MAVKLKTPSEIEIMHQAGQTVCRVLEHLAELIAPGVTTAELDDQAQRMITQAGCDALFKGVPKGGRALDFGCGPGRAMVKYQDRLDSIDGVDISPKNIDKAIEYLDCAGIHRTTLDVNNGVYLEHVA